MRSMIHEDRSGVGVSGDGRLAGSVESGWGNEDSRQGAAPKVY